MNYLRECEIQEKDGFYCAEQLILKPEIPKC